MTSQWSVAENDINKPVKTSFVNKTIESSAIGVGSIVKGIVSFSGSVRVDGVIEGDLTCSSEIYVGEAGKIKANIRADVVKVFGTVLGDISAESLIELYAGSKVVGNIKAARVAIHDGVSFQGQCKMTEPKKQNVVQLDSVLPKEGL